MLSKLKSDRQSIDEQMHEAVVNANANKQQIETKQKDVEKLLKKIVDSTSNQQNVMMLVEQGKDKMDSLSKKLKDIEEEKYVLGNKLETGSKGSDAVAPIEKRIKQLQEDLQSKRDSIIGDKESIKQLESKLKNGMKAKQRVDEDIQKYNTEIENMNDEIEKLKQIVSSITNLE